MIPGDDGSGSIGDVSGSGGYVSVLSEGWAISNGMSFARGRCAIPLLPVLVTVSSCAPRTLLSFPMTSLTTLPILHKDRGRLVSSLMSTISPTTSWRLSPHC